MHQFLVPVLFDLFSSEGLDKDKLLRGTGFNKIENALESAITPSQVDTICANAVKLSNDPLLGLKVGSKLDLVSLGILGYALMSCATVVDSLRLLLRYSKMLHPSVQVILEASENDLAVICTATELPDFLERHYIESAFAAVAHNLFILTGQRVRSISAEFPYDLPKNIKPYKEIFGDKIFFNSSRFALILSNSTLSMNISSSNASAQAIFRRECDRLMSSESQFGIISERVKDIFLSSRLDFPNCKKVAEKLHMSESTLHRRLIKEGTGYQYLLDQVRFILAKEYLQETNLPASEIGFLLGYSNPANFRRSFKRWSGHSPSKLRE